MIIPRESSARQGSNPRGPLAFLAVSPAACVVGLIDSGAETPRYTVLSGAGVGKAAECPPVKDCVAAATSLADGWRSEVEAAVKDTLPVSAETWEPKLFSLARRLKAMPGLAGAEPDALLRIAEDWHAGAAAVHRVDLDRGKVLAAFRRAWKSVRCPDGEGPLERIFGGSLADPPSAADRYDGNRRMLASFIWHLSRDTGDDFFLSCRTVGRLLDIHFSRAAAHLRGLVRDGWLEIASRGDYASGRASEYHLGPTASDTPPSATSSGLRLAA